MKLFANLLLFGCLHLASTDMPMRKSLLFPLETDTSYVELIPQRNLSMTSFTLCMRLATELATGNREIILFAYRTQNYDELNVWRESNGTYSLYLATSNVNNAVVFKLPELNAFQTHLCLTWESQFGLTAFYVDGRRSLRKVYNVGHKVTAGGRVILGQDADAFLGKFDKKQSFVGEITDVNMWNYVLPTAIIKDLHAGKYAPRGNVFDWETINMKVNGNASVICDRSVV
ncbi:hypothetical protein UPYG_G00019190 [Umbra pygmaea]|uniref:Pentraxin family member n=1 Tax=Umbra pygmaea TaxID=75934 RepID=A0ABD0Y4E9_UMBPY